LLYRQHHGLFIYAVTHAACFMLPVWSLLVYRIFYSICQNRKSYGHFFKFNTSGYEWITSAHRSKRCTEWFHSTRQDQVDREETGRAQLTKSQRLAKDWSHIGRGTLLWCALAIHSCALKLNLKKLSTGFSVLRQKPV